MTDADWVAAFVNTQRCQNIPDICEILSRQGINCSVQRFKGIQRKHPEWTKEEVIGYVMLHEGHHTNKIYYLDVDNKRYTLTQICNKLGLNYTKYLNL